jgi:hypothetical protein
MSRSLDPFSGPGKILIDKALTLCKLLLTNHDRFYPFAAIYENGKVGCLFGDDNSKKRLVEADPENSQKLIEHLQWRIVDNTTDTDSYAILVYAAQVESSENFDIQQDAIVVTLTGPEDEDKLIVYPYYRRQKDIFVAPPLVEK